MNERLNLRMVARLAGVLAVVFGALVLFGCGGGAGGQEGGGSLSLVAYSTPREAYEELTGAFAETEAGQGVTFETSFGSSGEQSRAVEGGLPADVAAFSLEPDMTRLVEAGLVEENWSDNEYDGMVTNSVVVLAVRKGNPEGIQDWDDLTREGIEVINPNPFTSGGAKWNIMAAYGAQLEQGASEEEAIEYLRQMFANIPVQDKSARESLATFTGGKGDVLLAYENEAIAAQRKGVELDYVIPDQTILIENPIAVTEQGKKNEKAAKFLEFLRSQEGQKIFVEEGYRPVLETVDDPERFPKPKQLFEITEFGGWSEVNDKFFDPDKGVMAEINKAKGVSTGGS